MNGSFELTLNNPLTKEDWDKIMDVELENTPSVTFKTPKGRQVKYIKADILDKIRAEIEELPTKTRINWDGICPDPDYPEIEYIDMTKKQLLQMIDKYKSESEE